MNVKVNVKSSTGRYKYEYEYEYEYEYKYETTNIVLRVYNTTYYPQPKQNL